MSIARLLLRLRKLQTLVALAILLSAFRCFVLIDCNSQDLPKPTDYVSDFAHVLSPQAIHEIDRVCTKLDHSNTDVQIAVVTIPSLNGADIGNYGRDLANSWGVGRKGSNRGVLVLLAVNDHKWRIAVGRGLEDILTDSKANRIGEKMIPRLRAKDYDGAVILVIHEIEQAIPAGMPDMPAPAQKRA